jgi:hypothetical protein
MARYDERTGGRHGYHGHGRAEHRGGYGEGRGYDRQGFDRGSQYRYDRDSGPSRWEGESWGDAAGGIYGPARYGLGPYYRRLLERRRPDDELKEEVEEALFYDSWVDAEAITVDVAEGVVTLHGRLPSYEEIRYAIDDAWDVDGVRGVRSELGLREDDD